MPRHSVHRRERTALVVPFVKPGPNRTIAIHCSLWGGLNAWAPIPLPLAHALGRELLDASESALMVETFPVSALPLVPAAAPARGAPQAGSPAIRPVGAVESRR